MDQAQYELYRADLEAGKVVQHDGRSASNIEELNWIAGLYPGVRLRGPDPRAATDAMAELRERIVELEAEGAGLLKQVDAQAARIVELEAEKSTLAEKVADMSDADLDPSEPDLETLTVAELKQLAEERGVELSSDARKPEIIEALKTAGE